MTTHIGSWRGIILAGCDPTAAYFSIPLQKWFKQRMSFELFDGTN